MLLLLQSFSDFNIKNLNKKNNSNLQLFLDIQRSGKQIWLRTPVNMNRRLLTKVISLMHHVIMLHTAYVFKCNRYITFPLPSTSWNNLGYAKTLSFLPALVHKKTQNLHEYLSGKFSHKLSMWEHKELPMSGFRPI